MPKTMCPLCGAKSHINTGAPELFETRYPEILKIGYICRLCWQCEGDLSSGDHVSLRDSHNAGLEGQIEYVADCGERGRLFQVKLNDGTFTTVPRSHLAKSQ